MSVEVDVWVWCNSCEMLQRVVRQPACCLSPCLPAAWAGSAAALAAAPLSSGTAMMNLLVPAALRSLLLPFLVGPASMCAQHVYDKALPAVEVACAL
jgi:hypothetical protein